MVCAPDCTCSGVPPAAELLSVNEFREDIVCDGGDQQHDKGGARAGPAALQVGEQEQADHHR
jgi:hypothetical protein